jgi:hypothetical protein
MNVARRLVDLLLEHDEADMSDPEEAREVEIGQEIKSLCGLAPEHETLKEIEALADELIAMHSLDSLMKHRPERRRVAEAYTDRNFRTKKELKDAVAAGKQIYVYQPNSDITGAEPPQNGTISVEGPHAPEPHRWYASVTLKDGVIVAVR